MVVDLPAPFGPRKPKVSPVATSKSMPRTASISPYLLVSALTEIAGLTLACPPPLPRRLPRGYGIAPAGCQTRSCRPAGPGPAGARLRHLRRGHHDLVDRVPQLDLDVVDAAGHGVPGRLELVGVFLDVRAALLGQRVHPASVFARGLGPDQGLVLEGCLQCRVHRPRARPPYALGARADLLDDLVAVPRLALGQQVRIAARTSPRRTRGPGRPNSAARTARRASRTRTARPQPPGPGPGPPRIRMRVRWPPRRSRGPRESPHSSLCIVILLGSV